MTVRDIINALLGLDPEAEVYYVDVDGTYLPVREAGIDDDGDVVMGYNL